MLCKVSEYRSNMTGYIGELVLPAVFYNNKYRKLCMGRSEYDSIKLKANSSSYPWKLNLRGMEHKISIFILIMEILHDCHDRKHKG